MTLLCGWVCDALGCRHLWFVCFNDCGCLKLIYLCDSTACGVWFFQLRLGWGVCVFVCIWQLIWVLAFVKVGLLSLNLLIWVGFTVVLVEMLLYMFVACWDLAP